MQECALCKFVSSDEADRLIHDGKFWKVVLSPDQQYLGKSFVSLKRHAEALRELTNEEYDELREIVRSFESSLIQGYQPTHFNWSCLMNRAANPANDERFHVHWHAIPRYSEPRGIEDWVFEDKRWPNSARDMKENLPNISVMDKIRKTIKSNW